MEWRASFHFRWFRVLRALLHERRGSRHTQMPVQRTTREHVSHRSLPSIHAMASAASSVLQTEEVVGNVVRALVLRHQLEQLRELDGLAAFNLKQHIRVRAH